VNPIALQAVGQRAIALVDGSADPSAFETLREGQAANATADDQDMERFGHLKLL
jgi:hypothetical protein